MSYKYGQLKCLKQRHYGYLIVIIELLINLVTYTYNVMFLFFLNVENFSNEYFDPPIIIYKIYNIKK